MRSGSDLLAQVRALLMKGFSASTDHRLGSECIFWCKSTWLGAIPQEMSVLICAIHSSRTLLVSRLFSILSPSSCASRTAAYSIYAEQELHPPKHLFIVSCFWAMPPRTPRSSLAGEASPTPLIRRRPLQTSSIRSAGLRPWPLPRSADRTGRTSRHDRTIRRFRTIRYGAPARPCRHSDDDEPYSSPRRRPCGRWLSFLRPRDQTLCKKNAITRMGAQYF